MPMNLFIQLCLIVLALGDDTETENYLDFRYRFENPTSRYDAMLMVIGDGSYTGPRHVINPLIVEKIVSSEPAIDWSSDSGYAREGLQYFEDTYGVVFPGVTEAFLKGEDATPINTADNAATLSVFAFGPDFEYRLASVCEDGRCRSVNTLVGDVALTVYFNEDFVSTGTYSGTIPALSTGAWGFYHMNDNDESYKIKFRMNGPMCPPVGGMSVFNCYLTSDKYGEGMARGIMLETGEMDSNDQMIYTIRNSISFPGEVSPFGGCSDPETGMPCSAVMYMPSMLVLCLLKLFTV